MNINSRWRLAMGGVVVAVLVAISISARLLEPCEMLWLDQVLRWRLALDLTPDVDRRIVHLDLGVEDLKSDAKEEYDDAAAIIEEAAACGAAVVAFDSVFLRGTGQTARKLRETIAAAGNENQCAVVLGEVLGGGLRRSFPFAARHQPAGFIDASEGSGSVFRSYRMLYRNGANLEPSFGLAAYLAWLRVDWQRDIQFDKAGEVRWSENEGGAQSATETPVLMNFRSPWRYSGTKAFRHCTRIELSAMTRELDPRSRKPLQGCILLVGQTENGDDVGTTPLGSRQPKIGNNIPVTTCH